MNPIERVETALKGLKPDRVPITPIYDWGYVMTSQGKDIRDYITSSAKQRIEYLENNFLRHKVDGFFIHKGCNDDWVNNNEVEKHKDYWMITEKLTGRRYRLLPDGCRAKEDGTPIARNLSNAGISKVLKKSDIDKEVPPVPSEEEVEDSGAFWPLKHISDKYPQYHFSFQIGSPYIRSISVCGGYEEGLTTMALERNLFIEIVERYTQVEEAFLVPGKKAGGRSIWLTSCYSGADTISPRDYAEVVFPYEKIICEKAKEQGLYVLYWFLGDLMPVLNKVMELPIDALVLEQGRKGYNIDPVEIRKYVGKNFCIFGYGYELDYCSFNRKGLKEEFKRQFEGAGKDGAFVAGTPIMPPNATPEAVDYYFEEVLRMGKYL
jgi:uroporphyrinogen-III decarboxylase